ncbi:MAG: hypothetical protein HC906_10995 [Bacteroidales bacterium]|nr:hypothetical protein [Bacteroidales bacterium]
MAGKWLAAFFSQLVIGFTKTQRNILFGLSSSHAVATLAVITVGFDLKILDENILNGTIILIFVTCLFASVVTENASKKLLLEESLEPLRKLIPVERIMVLISNPLTLKRLIDLAIMIKRPEDENEINTVSIVEET